MALNQGLHDEAEALLEEGCTLARELDDVGLTGSLLLTLAAAVSDRDEARAEALYAELLIFVEDNGEERFPRAFINLAEFALRRGEYAKAEQYSRKSLLLLREEGDTWSTALALGNLGPGCGAPSNRRARQYSSSDRSGTSLLARSGSDPEAIACKGKRAGRSSWRVPQPAVH